MSNRTKSIESGCMQRKKQIWVDADACPNVIKTILYRAAERCQCMLILVANSPLTVPGSRWIKKITVEQGFDVADKYIVNRVIEGDIVVTADIPLADELVARKVKVISPRGELFTQENIRQRLQMRDILEQVRDSGIRTGGPAPFSARDKQLFANQLDRLLVVKG